MPRFPLLLVGWLCSGAALAAPPVGMRILQHQAIKMSPGSDGGGRTLQFDAYGRRFELQLERNEHMKFVDARRMPGVEAMRGVVLGARGSWVRLTRTPAGLFGLLFDGDEFYAIEPASAAAGHAVGPMEARGTAPIIYRLADTLLPPGEASCGVVTLDDLPALRTGSAAKALEGVAAELQALAATLPTKQIEVAVVGDFEFGALSPGGLTPEAAIAARMNIVDGIYASQIGVQVIVADVNVFRNASDPFTSTTVPSTLLGELATWRQATPAQSSRGLTHLVTGRDLDGTTVGIAFLGSVCNSRAGAGLTQGTLSTTSSALVIAHEMGHNFGAVHDGETGTACETTAQTFLMAPRLNGSDQFSACSLASIGPVVGNARCIGARNVPDADLDLPASTRRLRGQAFDYTFNVRSIGATTVDGIVVTATLPAGLVANSSAVSGGNPCTSTGPGTLSCSVGSLAPQATRAITLNLTPQQPGARTLAVSITATNDASAGNDAAQVSFTVDPSADLQVTSAVAPASFLSGGSAQLIATVRHLAGDSVSDARLSFEVPDGLTVTAVGSNVFGCALQGAAVSCVPTSLAAGAAQSVALTLTAGAAGSRIVRSAIAASLGDPVSANNSAQSTLETTVPQVMVSAAGGGGGGSTGIGSLLALLLWRLRSVRAADPRRLVRRAP